MDNFFTGSHANIAHHFGKPNFELIRHDIVEPILLEARARRAITSGCLPPALRLCGSPQSATGGAPGRHLLRAPPV